MIRYLPDYKTATNAAYETLQNYNGNFPNINPLLFLSSRNNVRVYTYSEAAKRNRCTFEQFVKNYASSEYGFTIANLEKNQFLVFYNETKSDTTIKFTLAHELGHIVLKHLEDNSITDKEANCFARNFLCPIQLIDNFELKTISDYVECFHISEPMASVSISLYNTDHYYITSDNYNIINDKIYCYITGYTLAELYG